MLGQFFRDLAPTQPLHYYQTCRLPRHCNVFVAYLDPPVKRISCPLFPGHIKVPGGQGGAQQPSNSPFHPFSHSPILFPLCASARLSSSSHSMLSPRRQDRQGNLRLVAIIDIPNPPLRPLRPRESSSFTSSMSPLSIVLSRRICNRLIGKASDKDSPLHLFSHSPILFPLCAPRVSARLLFFCITPSPPSLSLSLPVLTVLTVKID